MKRFFGTARFVAFLVSRVDCPERASHDHQENRTEFLYHPDGKSVYVRTFGCSHNMSDGEYMKGLLSQGGYNITLNKEEADVW